MSESHPVRRGLLLLRLLCALSVWNCLLMRADSVVVFNEIMYHPSNNDEAGEWVELHNQMAVNVELGGWSIRGGIQFQFPPEAIIPGGGYLVIAAAPADLARSRGVTNALGPFTGHLSNSGDRLELSNNDGRLMDSVSYGIAEDWPVGPNGSGASLAKRDDDSASDLPQNWTVSALVGGTPGERNFVATPFQLTQTKPITMSSPWLFRAADTNLASSWIGVEFDDGIWMTGTALFGGESASPPLGSLQPITSVFSSGIGPDGTVLSPGSLDPHYLLTQSAQGSPPPPAIAATVIQNHPAWAANDLNSGWIGPVNPGTANVAAGIYNYQTTFNLDGFDLASALLTLSVGADNRLNSVQLNGVNQNISFVGFSSMSDPFPITNGFKSGVNTLDFSTANDTTSPNPAGFRVRLQGAARPRWQISNPLPTGPTTYLFRSSFFVAGDPASTALQLSSLFADGAVFYLNGREVIRYNLPPGPIAPSTLAVSNIVAPIVLGPWPLPAASLLAGSNILAVEVHQGAGDRRDWLFGAELSLTTTNVLAPPPVPLAINEISIANDAQASIELMNYSSADIDLGNCVLAKRSDSGDGEYLFPTGKLAGGSFAAMTPSELGFAIKPGDRLFLYPPGRRSVIDAMVIPLKSSGRWPDGTGRWYFASTATLGSPNQVTFHPEIVINEIMYHPPPTQITSSNDHPLAVGQWLELYNRSDHSVDLSDWSLARDIEFAIPPGTGLAPGEYLVVAKNVQAMQTQFPNVRVLGPFQHDLRHRNGHLLLADAAGNPANEVQYLDGKPWPEWPDGQGSSLELRDPWADNSKPEAWAASVESSRSAWNQYTYRGVAANGSGPSQWKEFVLGLLDAGECLVDDLSVVENPATAPVQLLPNGNFETGLTGWRELGTHNRSSVEVDPDNPQNHVLHLVATAATEHMHNHLETTLANGKSVVNGREYEISFRAKWLAGNNRLNTRLYFNRLAQTAVLPLPLLSGTPGAPNSVRVTNVGPTFAELDQQPVVPKANEQVAIDVSASDPQGVAAMVLWWSADRVAWHQIRMEPAGISTIPGYVRYRAIIPPQAAGTVVQFYVSATDGQKAVATFPAGGPDSRALFKVDEGQALLPKLHRIRLLMTPSDTAFLHASTNVMSNDRLGATLIYDDREVFYDVGLHLQSSEHGRDDTSRVGFAVQFNQDHLFRGVQHALTIDRSGGYAGVGGRHGEILLWQAVNHAGGLLGFHCDLIQCFAPRAQEDGTGLLRMSAFDGDYFDAQYENGSAGNLFKLELIYAPTTTVDGNPQSAKLPQPDSITNIDIQNSGGASENYRWTFLQKNHADQDDYSQIVALNQAFSLSSPSLDARLTQLMDIDQWMRTLAFKAFTGDADTFTYGLNHNWLIYFRPTDGKALGLLWDMDYAFAEPVNNAVPGTTSPTMLKITRLPNNLRSFYSHVLDLSTTTINSSYLAPWAKHFSGLLSEDWSDAVNYLQQRSSYLRSRLPLDTPFAITAPSDQGLMVDTNFVTLSGTAPLTLQTILVNGLEFPLTWRNLTNWTVTVPLASYANQLLVEGVDHRGTALTNASIRLVVTNSSALPRQSVVINEWMAENTSPGGFFNSVENGFPDWFELFNPNSIPVDLSGFYLTDNLKEPDLWKIPNNTTIPARGFLLVWADNATELNGTNESTDLHVNFQLAKSGDSIGLFAPDGTLEHAVTFAAQISNVSEGLYPDGNTNSLFDFPTWTPGSPNVLDALVSPDFTQVRTSLSGGVALSFRTVAGHTYQVQFADDLKAAFWSPLGARLTATTASSIALDPSFSRPRRFYRVVLVP